jgi:hypothetical protein
MKSRSANQSTKSFSEEPGDVEIQNVIADSIPLYIRKKLADLESCSRFVVVTAALMTILCSGI